MRQATNPCPISPVSPAEALDLRKIAQSDHPVLLLGETGTGKEVTARKTHALGPRRHHPFLPIDCGSLTPSLIETELFGYAKGAFTGASSNKTGLLQLADDGTLFLDEVGELPVELQSRLLRVLQEREFRPVGSHETIPIHARIIAATNRNLQEEIKNGKFRADLYYRLRVIEIELAPLRKRLAELPEIVDLLLPSICNCGRRWAVSEDALALLALYPWPGNIRELENCLKRAHLVSDCATVLQPDHLPAELLMRPGSDIKIGPSELGIIPLEELERNAILHALHKCGGNRNVAAAKLGIGKTTLYRKLIGYAGETRAEQFRRRA